MKIRKIEADQVALINSLAYRIWPDAFKDILRPEQIEYMLNWMYAPQKLAEQLESGHHFFVIEENNEALGFIGIEPAFPTSDSLRIHKIYVLPNQQGKGVGKQLIDHAIEFARHKNLSKLHLNVNRFNKAVDFYRYIGFRIIGEENINIGSGFLMEDYIMEMEINS
jgi:GNAT superfamily N-acetyltransferase